MKFGHVFTRDQIWRGHEFAVTTHGWRPRAARRLRGLQGGAGCNRSSVRAARRQVALPDQGLASRRAQAQLWCSCAHRDPRAAKEQAQQTKERDMLGCLERVQELITKEHSSSACLAAAAEAVAAEAAAAAGPSALSTAFEAIGAGQPNRRPPPPRKPPLPRVLPGRRWRRSSRRSTKRWRPRRRRLRGSRRRYALFAFELRAARYRAPLVRLVPDFRMRTRVFAPLIEPHAISPRDSVNVSTFAIAITIAIRLAGGRRPRGRWVRAQEAEGRGGGCGAGIRGLVNP